jgi:hypothetical protein
VSHSSRAHSCVVHPELKNTRPSLGGKYSRMFPGLLPCEVDLERSVGLGRPTLPSAQPGKFGMADLVVFAGTAGASW